MIQYFRTCHHDLKELTPKGDTLRTIIQGSIDCSRCTKPKQPRRAYPEEPDPYLFQHVVEFREKSRKLLDFAGRQDLRAELFGMLYAIIWTIRRESSVEPQPDGKWSKIGRLTPLGEESKRMLKSAIDWVLEQCSAKVERRPLSARTSAPTARRSVMAAR